MPPFAALLTLLCRKKARPGIEYNGRYTFTEYEAGMRSLRGRPRKFSQDDEEGLRKQGIPRTS